MNYKIVITNIKIQTYSMVIEANSKIEANRCAKEFETFDWLPYKYDENVIKCQDIDVNSTNEPAIKDPVYGDTKPWYRN